MIRVITRILAVPTIAITLVGGWVLLSSRLRPPLPVFGQAPSFSLKDASGVEVHSQELAGNVWVVSFLFTHCAGTCPKTTSELARIVQHTPSSAPVRFVSITLDPERDTPERLEEMARKVGADRSRWFFLRGTAEEAQNLAVQGFHLGVSPGNPDQGDDFIVHSDRLALVDRRGLIRGYYDSTDQSALDALQEGLKAVLNEP